MTVCVAEGRNDIEVAELDDVVYLSWTFLLKDAIYYVQLLAHEARPVKPPSTVELIIRTRLSADW